MLGVLLNLLLGLSRVLLAMGRRGDMPSPVARLNQAGTTPTVAVVVVGVVIAGLVLVGNVKLTWSFSAFTVLIYYATNDTQTYVAVSSVDKLVDYCLHTPEDPLRSYACVQQRIELADRNKAFLANNPVHPLA